MYLFKHTHSPLKRLMQNLLVYGYGGTFVMMMFTVALPDLSEILYILTVLTSLAAVTGTLMAIGGAIRGLFCIGPVRSVQALISNPVARDGLLLCRLSYQERPHNAYLTADRRIALLPTAGMYLAPTMLASRKEAVYLSFRQFRRLITADSAEAMPFAAMNKENCFALAADHLYPRGTDTTSTQALFARQQQALIAAGVVFATITDNMPTLPDYAVPYDTFRQEVDERFVLERAGEMERHFIAYHKGEGQYYEVYNRTIGNSNLSRFNRSTCIFDPTHKSPIRPLTAPEVVATLHRYRYTYNLLYLYGDRGETYRTIQLAFRTDGTLALVDQCRYERDVWSKDFPLEADFFAGRTPENFITYLSEKFHTDCMDLDRREGYHPLIQLLNEVQKA